MKSGGKQKMVLKFGNVVDPECEVADVTHIYKQESDVYSVVLSAVDLSKNRNSFYKLQLLEHDTKKTKYFVFKAWGRVGTTIGGTTLEEFSTVSDAIHYFTEHYVDKTGNEWSARHHFQKVPDKYFPVDIDFAGDQTDSMAKLEVGKRSKLALSVQDFICSIFDVQKMREQMLEFVLDMEKMPLGVLSRNQLLYSRYHLLVLSELVKEEPQNTSQLKSATNEFYTLIPHNFGTERPPLIDTEAAIKTKMDMLDALLDVYIQFDIKMLKNRPYMQNSDPLHQHYRILCTTIEPLSKTGQEFNIIEKYLKNTHTSTHHFSLDIVDAFKIEREGESERFQKHKDSDNRLLLWHGSRVTNFVGILSDGLLVAPKGVPSNGRHTFGKGIYFSDMVTAAAGYCYYQYNKNVGYLLLSEVAVGKTWDLMIAKPDVVSPPDGYHSVKGVGQTQPDPMKDHVMSNGTRVPSGPTVKSDQKCSLLYNEFVVYDISQVNVKYLLKCQFKLKIHCSDICQYLYTNGVYNGIRLYRHWEQSSQISTHKMYAKGNEWSFHIENNGNKGLRVSSNVSSVESIDKSIVNIFSGLIPTNGYTNNPGLYGITPENTGLTSSGTNCSIPQSTGTVFDDSVHYYRQGIIFSPVVGRKDRPNNYVIVLKTSDHSVEVLRVSDDPKNLLTIITDPSTCKSPECQPLMITTELPDKLLDKLEGIVDYEVSAESAGHMLWFAINGQPINYLLLLLALFVILSVGILIVFSVFDKKETESDVENSGQTPVKTDS
ncbi:unnamed protein product, partial [Medioppia subpectinata]